jgi:NADPH:quinone reductase-like Zn-dependent oxidoreductase
VNSSDARMRAARFPKGFSVPSRLIFGVVRPRRKILGSCFAGTIESVGSRVSGFAPGDRVCGMTGIAMGAHAQYLAVAAKKVARTPAAVVDEDAAALLFGGTTALFFLRDKAHVKPRMTVLVNGASGAVGTNAVQLAKHLGAQVTAVTSAANTALVARLGADRIVDYATHPVADLDERFDVVFDAVGNITIDGGRRLLSTDGVLVLAVAGLGEMVRARGNVVAGPSRERVEDFDYLLQLLANGEMTVVHDQAYELNDIVDAYRRVDTGRKRGNVIVRPWS